MFFVGQLGGMGWYRPETISVSHTLKALSDFERRLIVNSEVKKWVDRINEREAVKRGLDVPEPFKMKEKMKTKEGEEEYSKYHSNWVMKG